MMKKWQSSHRNLSHSLSLYSSVTINYWWHYICITWHNNHGEYMWNMISNSLDIDFIYGHIYGWQCKKKPIPALLMSCGVYENWSCENKATLHQVLTHWGRDKMAAISQTTFSNAFSWMKMFKYRLKFHWILFWRDQLTIFQHRFR